MGQFSPTCPSVCGVGWYALFYLKQIMVTAGTYSMIKTKRETRHCTVEYKLSLTCKEMKLSCKYFNLPNENPAKCNRGDFLRVKVGLKQGNPKVLRFCESQSPTVYNPLLSDKSLRVQYRAVRRSDQMGAVQWARRGMVCFVVCSSIFQG